MAHESVAYSSMSATQAELNALTVTFEGTVAIWTCPRCKAEFRQSVRTDRPTYGFDVESLDAEKVGKLDLVCACGTKHEGGGDNANCGFAAQLPVRRQ